MTGAPECSGTAGALIGVLDACLVNGFGQVSVSSLVVASDVATVTTSSTHGFAMLGNTGPVIKIEGATPSSLNGEWRIASVPTSTSFTFTTADISDQTATGTITVKRAPAGWEKRYSGTNTAAYARTAVEATEMLLRVDDTPTQYPVLTMYESMTDVDTGENGSGLQYAYKSNAANTLARTWVLVADDRTFWLFTDGSGSNFWAFHGFGDLVSYRAADAYRAFLRAGNIISTAIYGTAAYLMASAGLCKLARALSNDPGAIDCFWYSHSKAGTSLGGVTQPTPATADSALHVWPIEAWDGATDARGLLPGLVLPIHAAASAVHGQAFTRLDGRDVVVQRVSNNTAYAVAFDITGPWQ